MKGTDQKLRELFRQPAMLPDYAEECLRTSYESLGERKKTEARRPVRRLSAAALAAMIGMMLLGSALAVGISRIDMVVEENGEVEFSYAEGGHPTYTGAWEITEPPEGFRRVSGVLVSYIPQMYGFSAEYAVEGAPNERLYLFVNTLDGAQMGRNFRKVSVNGNEGILYYSELLEDVESALIWSDSQRGIVFTLEYFGERKLDLEAIGESVAECDYIPSEEEQEQYRLAAEALGERTLEVPGGYEPLFQQGAADGTWVTKAWVNGLNKVISLEYRVLEDATVGIRDYVVNLEYPISVYYDRRWVTVNGMDACYALNRSADGEQTLLLWLDRESGLAFTLRAEGISQEEMTALAGSVT